MLVFSLGSFFVPCRCVFRDGYESWDTMHASFVSYVMMRAAPEFEKQQRLNTGPVLARPDPKYQHGHGATRAGTAAGQSVASTSSDAETRDASPAATVAAQTWLAKAEDAARSPQRATILRGVSEG